MVAVGIDLGTTFSCVGWWKDNRCESTSQMIKVIEQHLHMLDLLKKKELLVMEQKNQKSVNPENTVFDAKRLIGRDFNDVTLQSDLKNFPFKVIWKG